MNPKRVKPDGKAFWPRSHVCLMQIGGLLRSFLRASLLTRPRFRAGRLPSSSLTKNFGAPLARSAKLCQTPCRLLRRAPRGSSWLDGGLLSAIRRKRSPVWTGRSIARPRRYRSANRCLRLFARAGSLPRTAKGRRFEVDVTAPFESIQASPQCEIAAAALIASLKGDDSLAAGKIAEIVRDLGTSERRELGRVCPARRKSARGMEAAPSCAGSVSQRPRQGFRTSFDEGREFP